MSLIDDLYRAKRKLEETTNTPAIHGVRVAPDVLAAMRRALPVWAGESDEDRCARAAIWGIPCIVDASLAPGTWDAAHDRETWLRWVEGGR